MREIEADADPEIIERLRTVFELDPWQVFPVNGPVNLSRLFNVYEQTKRPDLKYRKALLRASCGSSPPNRGIYSEEFAAAMTFCCTIPTIHA